MAKHIIFISKARRDMSVDMDNIPDDMFQKVMAAGLKVLLNRKMAKISILSTLTYEQRGHARDEAWDAAQHNLKALEDGSYK